MRRSFVQFALDSEKIEMLKFYALEKGVTLTALLQYLVYVFLESIADEKVKNNQGASAPESEE